MTLESISYEDFKKIDLRIAEIKSVEDHPNADKLFVIKVELDNGTERQIVAGIKPWYTKEELTGKKIAIIVNLEPAVLRGVESQGMLLAAGTDDRSSVVVLTPDKDIPPGSKIS